MIILIMSVMLRQEWNDNPDNEDEAEPGVE